MLSLNVITFDRMSRGSDGWPGFVIRTPYLVSEETTVVVAWKVTWFADRNPKVFTVDDSTLLTGSVSLDGSVCSKSVVDPGAY